MTIAELMLELARYPSDSSIYAYEGEVVGLVVVLPGTVPPGHEVIACPEPSSRGIGT